MKTLIITLAIIASSSAALADVYVNGYYKSNGTYVNPYHRTYPDANPYNNYEYTRRPYQYGR